MCGLRSCLTRIGLAVTEQHLANAGCGWQCHACDLHGNGMPSMPPTGTMEADLLSGGRPDGDTTPDMADSLSQQDRLVSVRMLLLLLRYAYVIPSLPSDSLVGSSHRH